MQILAPTWNAILARHRIPAGGARPPSRYNPHDAIHAAAYYLCDNGAGRGQIRAALYAYNHSPAYIEQVFAVARSYAQTNPTTSATCSPPRSSAPPPRGGHQHRRRRHRRRAGADRGPVRLRPTRQALRLGRQRRGRLRLLRTHPRRLRRWRHRHPPHRPNPVQLRAPASCRDPAAARRPGVLRHPTPHPPRRDLPRRYPDRQRPRLRADRQDRRPPELRRLRWSKPASSGRHTTALNAGQAQLLHHRGQASRRTRTSQTAGTGTSRGDGHPTRPAAAVPLMARTV